jgi:hypothetical protein
MSEKTPAITLSGEQFEKLLSMIGRPGASQNSISVSPEEARWLERNDAAELDLAKLHIRRFRASRTGQANFTSEPIKTTCVLEVQFGERSNPNEGRVVRLSERDESAALQACFESMLPQIESAILEARRIGDAVREQQLKQSIMKPSGVHGQPGARHVVCTEISLPTLRESVGRWVTITEDGKIIGLPGSWTVGEEVTESAEYVRWDSDEAKAARSRSESESEAHRKANLLSPEERREKEARAAAAYQGVVR